MGAERTAHSGKQRLTPPFPAGLGASGNAGLSLRGVGEMGNPQEAREPRQSCRGRVRLHQELSGRQLSARGGLARSCRMFAQSH